MPARGRGRQTVQWPFQSIITEDTEYSVPTILPIPFRRATWQHRGQEREAKDDDSVWGPPDQSIIPDYVVNYLKGETPESIAHKAQTDEVASPRRAAHAVPALDRQQPQGYNGQQGHQSHQSHQGHQHHHGHQRQKPSRVLELEAFVDVESIRSRESRTTGSSVRGSQERMLRDDEKRPPKGSRRITHGWRGGVAVNLLLCFLILVVGFVALIMVVSKAPMAGGESLVFQGACAAAARIDTGFQAVIAVMVVILLAGANYVFQVLSAPTRPELDAAHEARRWLDIGIPSVRNLAHIARSRVALAVAVVFAATATQVIYASVIFTTQYSVDFDLVFVTRGFLTGAPFSNATATNAGGLGRIEILQLQDLARSGGLVNMTAAECMQEFGGAFTARSFETVLVVTNIANPPSSVLQTGIPGMRLSAFRAAAGDGRTTLADPSTLAFCLAEPAGGQPQCAVSLNASLLVVVALLNLAAMICTASVLAKSAGYRPLVTLGDALASFLEFPDPTTRDACLLTKTDVWRGRWGFSEAKYWVPRTHRWFATPSLPRWLFASAVWWLLFGVVAAALGVSVHASPTGRLSPFGQPSPHGLLALPASAPAGAVAVLAALPHLVLAALYLAGNSLLSTLFLGHEASLFALPERRPLRVGANPAGEQVTSLYLTLPRPWSWALLVLFAAAAFLLRSGVMLVDVRPNPATLFPAGTAMNSTRMPVRAVGFSGTALALLLALLVVMALVVLGLACRKAPAAAPGRKTGTPGGNPLVLPAGSCSAVFSARCHPSDEYGDGERDAWRRGLRWGVTGTSEATGVAHCGFSAGKGVEGVDLTRCYA
jgi:hypothetical protein